MKIRTALIASAPRIRCVRGFTLIELMITVVVIGILAAIAYPSYTDYIRRGKISQATSELSAMRVRLEQYYQDNRNYGSTATTCPGTLPTAPSFTFSCVWGSTGTNQTFVATATGTAAGGMNGFAFTVNDANTQRTTAFVGATGLPVDCWMKRRGDVC